MTEEELEEIAQKGSGDQRRAVARHPNTSLSLLVRLSDEGYADDVDQNPMIALYVETNTQQGVTILEYLANQSTRPERLRELANSPHDDVRGGVAFNTKTPSETLVSLANDEYWYVRANVACNSSTPPEVASRLVEDVDTDVRGKIAMMTEDVSKLEIFSKDKESFVREAVASNKSTPMSILLELKNDPSEMVRDVVRVSIGLLNDSPTAKFKKT